MFGRLWKTRMGHENPLSGSLVTTDLRADLLIAGGGMVGLSLAVAVARAGIRSVVVDIADPEDILNEAFDGRASAIAYAPGRMLDEIGVWRHLEDKAQPILEIRVADGRVPDGVGGGVGGVGGDGGPSPLFLHFDNRDLGDGPLGHLVENRHLRAALYAEVAKTGLVTLLAPARLGDIERGAEGVRAVVHDLEGTSGPLEVRAALVVGAEGRNSPLRQAAGIGTVGWAYDQHGVVATVSHTHDHGGVAQEYFLPSGPFAILPLTGRRSSLVWTEKPEAAEALMALPDPAFDAHLRERFGDYLGDVNALGPRWCYPMGVFHARRYVDRRLVLVGDAAHGMHPIAGQGLNLGLRDVACLAEVLADGLRLGRDLGSAGLLARYQRWRRFDNLALLAATDGLNRLFSNDLPPLRLVRGLGLAAVNRLAPLKRLFMRHARGTVGKLPRLLAGRPL